MRVPHPESHSEAAAEECKREPEPCADGRVAPVESRRARGDERCRDRPGAPETAAVVRTHRGAARLELGDGTGARADLAAMAKLAAELHQPSQDWYVAEARAHHALLGGHFAEAEDLIEDSLSLGRSAQSWNAVQSSRLQLYVLRRQQGRLAEMDELVRRSVDEYPTYRIWRCVLAQMAAELGYETESRGTFEALARERFAGLPFDELWIVSLGLLAEAAALLNHARGAEILYGLLLPYSGRVAGPTPEISTGSAARYLGLLATTTERFENAEHHFEEAITMNQRIGARPWLAHTQQDFADMLLTRGSAGDVEKARGLLEQAIEEYRELGMESHAVRAAARSDVRLHRRLR